MPEPTTAQQQEAQKQPPLQFVTMDQLLKVDKAKSVLIPTAQENANQVHPFQRHLIKPAEGYARFLPKENQNPFTSSPLFLPMAPDTTEAQVDAAVQQMARRVGAGEKFFIAVEAGFDPNNPSSLKLVGAEGCSDSFRSYLQQRLMVLNHIATGVHGAKHVMALQKNNQGISLDDALKKVAPDSHPGHAEMRPLFKSYIRYLGDKSSRATLPAIPAGGRDASFMQAAAAEGYDGKAETITYVNIGSNEKKQRHSEIFANSVMTDTQNNENKSIINAILKITKTAQVEKLAAFCCKHRIALSNLFKGIDEQSKGRTHIERQLKFVAEQTLTLAAEREKAVLCQVYKFAQYAKSGLSTNQEAQKDALQALAEHGVVMPQNHLTDSNVEALLRELPLYRKSDVADPNKSKNIVISQKVIRVADDLGGLKNALTQDLKDHFSVLAAGAGILTENTVTDINYMLKVGDQYYKLKIRLNYNADNNTYTPTLSLQSVVTNQEIPENIWTAAARKEINKAIREAGQSEVVAEGVAPTGLALGGLFRNIPNVDQTNKQAAGTEAHLTPLVIIADWASELGDPHPILVGCPGEGNDDHCYSREELEQLRLRAIKIVANKDEHQDELFVDGGVVYSATRDAAEHAEFMQSRRKNKKKVMEMQAEYHASMVDAEKTIEALGAQLRSAKADDDGVGNYSLRCTHPSGNHETVMVHRKVAPMGDAVRYSLEGAECENETDALRYLKDFLVPMIIAEHMQRATGMSEIDRKNHDTGLVFEISEHSFSLSNKEIAEAFFAAGDETFSKIVFTGTDPAEEIKNKKFNSSQPSNASKDDEALSFDLENGVVSNTDIDRNGLVGDLYGIQRDGFDDEEQHSVVSCLMSGIKDHKKLVNAKLKNALDSKEAKEYINQHKNDAEFVRFHGLLKNLDRRVFRLLCDRNARSVSDSEKEELQAVMMGLQLPNGHQETAQASLDSLQFSGDRSWGQSLSTSPYTRAKRILGSSFGAENDNNEIERVVKSVQQENDTLDVPENKRRATNRERFENAVNANAEFTNHKPGVVSRYATASYSRVQAVMPKYAVDTYNATTRLPGYALSSVATQFKGVNWRSPMTYVGGAFGIMRKYATTTALGGVALNYGALPVMNGMNSMSGGRLGTMAYYADDSTGNYVGALCNGVVRILNEGILSTLRSAATDPAASLHQSLKAALVEAATVSKTIPRGEPLSWIREGMSDAVAMLPEVSLSEISEEALLLMFFLIAAAHFASVVIKAQRERSGAESVIEELDDNGEPQAQDQGARDAAAPAPANRAAHVYALLMHGLNQMTRCGARQTSGFGFPNIYTLLLKRAEKNKSNRDNGAQMGAGVPVQHT